MLVRAGITDGQLKLSASIMATVDAEGPVDASAKALIAMKVAQDCINFVALLASFEPISCSTSL